MARGGQSVNHRQAVVTPSMVSSPLNQHLGLTSLHHKGSKDILKIFQGMVKRLPFIALPTRWGLERREAKMIVTAARLVGQRSPFGLHEQHYHL